MTATENRFDLIVIGGGIIGLATAMAALRQLPRLRLAVLEKEARLAMHQSGRNSGVIHSGVYYQPGSLKAQLCVQGAAEMAAFCQAHGLPYERCGKVIVATEDREIPALEELYRRGAANGVPQLALLGPEKLREIEPHARAVRALHVPSTAITDYVAVSEKFGEIVAARGGEIRTSSRVFAIERRSGENILETTTGSFSARAVVNCAGLQSDRISKMAKASTDLTIVPFRGEYYELAPERRSLVRGLIYPVPDPSLPFLGVHLTRKIKGSIEAGPNAVLAFKREGYRKRDVSPVDTMGILAWPGSWRMARKYWRIGLSEFWRSFSTSAFVRALQKLVPDLDESDLLPGGSGVRAQALDRKGNLLDDFCFVATEGMVHVCNVPSPAATASIAIGEKIADFLKANLDLRCA